MAKWKVRTTRLVKQRMKTSTAYFDVVVLASGHYNMPRIIDVPGLAGWEQSSFLPGSAIRRGIGDAKRYAGRTVLLVGAGVSYVETAKETVAAHGELVQSSRDGAFDLPKNVARTTNDKKNLRLKNSRAVRRTEAGPGEER